MIKNLIIILLIYIIGVLLFASSSNVDLLKQKAVEAKEFIRKGVNYIDDAVDNLNSENLSAKYMGNVGNIMIDTLEKNLEKILQSSDQIKEKLNITGKYFVVTIHRPSNLSDENLAKIFAGLKEFSNEYQIVLPAHPRLKKYINDNDLGQF